MRLKWGARVLVAALVFLRAFFDPYPAGTGLGPSWQLGLTQASLSGLVFGRDVVFTYGPLSYLAVGVGVGPFYWQMLACSVILALLVAGLVAYCATETGGILPGSRLLIGYPRLPHRHHADRHADARPYRPFHASALSGPKAGRTNGTGSRSGVRRRSSHEVQHRRRRVRQRFRFVRTWGSTWSVGKQGRRVTCSVCALRRVYRGFDAPVRAFGSWGSLSRWRWRPWR